MKRKIWIVSGIVLLLCAFFGFLRGLKQPPKPPVLPDPNQQEKQLLQEPISNLKTLKKAMEQYFKNPGNATQSDILLQEILLLAEMDLINGQWDEGMGIYTTPHYVYIGGCYSDWCYVEANRKDSSYSLYLQYNGNKWVKQHCSTQRTELGRFICNHLKSSGWKYIEGEE